MSMPVPAGTMLGPYKLLGMIGAGGMGQVYRARDQRLDRTVAIKIASEQFGARFEREARAIAQLNHPHICTLHDVGPNYLVMELVEGETLSARLRRGFLPLDQVLRFGAQIADALAAAHAKGIIHRDLKPGNIMLTKSGVKILDFGLAKMPVSRDETLTIGNAVIGTPAYMAPEQLEGAAADHRTDLFSLGLVLFEMLTGKLPHSGAPSGAILMAGVDFPAPSRARRGVPAKLDGIVLRLLERSPSRRFQSAQELSDELAKLQQPVRITIRSVAAGVVLMALVASGAWWLGARRGRQTGALNYERLTNFPDSVHSPALSKDGKMLAFVRGPMTFLEGPGQIYLQVLPKGQPVALTQDQDVKMAPVFSPDGARIVYTASNRDWSSMSVPIAGGPSTVMLTNAASLRWIGPTQVLFSEIKSGFHMGLVTAGQDRASPRSVYFPESPQGMVHFSEVSPDGKSVLAVEMLNAVWEPCRLVPFDGTSAGKQVGPPGALCTAATWSPDGQWMYFAAEVNGESHLWRQRFPDGLPEQLTRGVDQESGVAVDRDGASLVTAVGSIQSTVWYHDERGERPLSVEGYAYRPLVSPDGTKVLYLVRRSVRGSIWSGELWSFDLSSGSNVRLLPGLPVQYFHVSSDGKTLVFDRFDKAGRSSLWIAPLDGSRPPRRLTPEDDDGEDQHPFLGRSGSVYFIRVVGDQRFLYRMNADGTGRRELRSVPGGHLVNLSPDEKLAVLWEGGSGVSLYPLAGGPTRSLCNCSAGPIFQDSPRISWSGDGRLLFVNAGGAMAGLGTTVVPWRSLEDLPAGTRLSGPELRRLAGAFELREISIAPGPGGNAYAFARVTDHANLYRIRLR